MGEGERNDPNIVCKYELKKKKTTEGGQISHARELVESIL
jgi:hypothetical protein